MQETPPVLISVCICTYHRSVMLKKCLESILLQEKDWPVEVNVIDNDFKGSAGKIVDEMKIAFHENGFQLNYFIEKQQGLSHARNRAIKESKGAHIVFIDDDEYAIPLWLKRLYNAMLEYNSDGVWGPVLPVFEEGFPDWVKVFFKPREMETGKAISHLFLNSGNLIIRKDCINNRKGPFDLSLSQIGSEDTELFNYLSRNGAKFVWCNEAIAYELNPLERGKLKWHIRRSYRGGWGFSMIHHRNKGFLKAILLVLVWIVPAIFKNLFRSFQFKHPKAIVFAWFKTFIEQAGKLGYFFRMDVKEYKKK